jgi:ZIP family zinc transporter
LGVALMLGAVIGALALGNTSPTTMHFVYAFGAVAFIFLVTEELLVEAHEVRERLWTPAYLVAGFIVFFLLSRLSG